MKQKAITISLIKENNNIEDNAAEQRMTSLEIAELTGKQHKNVMQAIRNMEPAWEKVTGLKFQLCEKSYLLANGVTKKQPFYQLTKTECLYIATKFNDEARARLVLRWQELFYHTWPTESGKHNYEIDFLLSRGTKIVPVEVKSSTYKTHVSMDEFCKKFSSRISNDSYLVYTKDYFKEGAMKYLPAYLAYFL